MREYMLRLEEYGISDEAYGEMRYFCWQYGEKKKMLEEILHNSPLPPSGMPKRSGVDDPTARHAVAMGNLLTDCEMIEQSALEAAGKSADEEGRQMYQHLLTQVTIKQGKPAVHTIPWGRRQFYDMRKLFFVLLFEKRAHRGSAMGT